MLKKHIYSKSKVLKRIEISRKKKLELEKENVNDIHDFSTSPETAGSENNVHKKIDVEIKTNRISRARTVKKK